MSLELLRSAIVPFARDTANFSIDAWLADEDMYAGKVALFRDYANGSHRSSMTTEMKKQLRISSDDELTQFNNNYMDVIIQTMNNRLEVDEIVADSEAADTWIADILRDNRFDMLQGSIHEAAIRDGDTYVMVSWSNDGQRVILTHEPAFDGVSGIIPIFSENRLEAAIKVWSVFETSSTSPSYQRINVYRPDEIQKYKSVSGGTLVAIEEPEQWTGRNGQPLGVPLIHFRNRPASYVNRGLSEIENAIPLQDALNRILYSLVMTAELSAFQIRIAKGFMPDAAVTPGMWLVIGQGDGDGGVMPIPAGVSADAYVLEAGTLNPFIDASKYLISQISSITQTPATEMIWDNSSGEALQMREVGLLKKCRRFSVGAGNSYENMIAFAHSVQQAFGKQPPALDFTSLNCHWKAPEIRNDAVAIKNILDLRDLIGDQAALEMLAPIMGWSPEKLIEINAAKSQRIAAQLASFNPFA